MRRLLGAILVFASTINAPSQSLETLHSFGTLINQAGIKPEAPFVAGPDGTLYGTTSDGIGGGLLKGAILAVKPSGDVRILKQLTNSFDGARPRSSLILQGDTLFGMTTDGGTNESGTIFRINSDGSGFAVLASLPTNSWTIPVENFPFATSLKSPPVGGLSVAADRIFGTTHGGGANAAGTIFSVSMSGGDFRILKDFAPLEGTAPCGDLVIADGVLYGTTSSGGAKKLGTIFRINSDGTGFASLMHFQTRSITGAVPLGGLVLNNGKLYGTTSEGGADFFGGTLFSIKTDGSDFQVLKTFVPSESNGTAPAGRLAFDNECLFGVTTKSGQSFSSFSSVYRLSLADNSFTNLGPLPWLSGQVSAGITVSHGSIFGSMLGHSSLAHAEAGTIFTLSTNGSAFRIITTFPGSLPGPLRPNPLILFEGYLYGTTVIGGRSNAGTIFRIGTNGNGFSILKEFGAGTDGENPCSRLTRIGNTLYGVCSGDFGPPYSGNGTLFKIQSDGTGYTVLHRFGSISADGSRSYGQPILLNGYLYGTTLNGGDSSNGTVYRIRPDGSGYEIVKSLFIADGYHPIELTLFGDSLYGTCFFGGTLSSPNGQGTLFKITSNEGFQVLSDFSATYPPIGRLVASGDVLYGAAFSKTAFLQPGSQGSLYPLDVGEIVSIRDGLPNSAVLATLKGTLRGDVSANGLAVSGNKLIGTLRGNTASLVAPPVTLRLQRALNPETSAAIFWLNTNGNDVASIYHFGPSHNGTWLNGDLVVDGEVLYGTAYAGGLAGGGTIFRLDLRPRLTIASTNNDVRISWPTYAGVTNLQVTTNFSDWHNLSGNVSTDESQFTVDLQTAIPVTGARILISSD